MLQSQSRAYLKSKILSLSNKSRKNRNQQLLSKIKKRKKRKRMYLRLPTKIIQLKLVRLMATNQNT